MIVSLQIDYVITSPIEILERLKGYKNVSCIVGNSFGGFFAYVLSNIYNIPSLLVNPCIPPDRYNGKMEYINSVSWMNIRRLTV